MNWKANSSGTMEITNIEQENAVCFHVNFEQNTDRWVYPEYSLKFPDESMNEGSVTKGYN